MKTTNLLAASTCFALSSTSGNGWIALLGFGSLLAFAVLVALDVVDATREAGK